VTQKAASEDLNDKVLNVWMIVYDGEASRVYSFGDHSKAMASIEGSIRGYLGDDLEEAICQRMMQVVQDRKYAPCIPLIIDKLQIVIYRWELDKMHPVHQVLRECYDSVNDDLKSKIAALFSTGHYD
jgi:hypothetical protein